MTEAGKYTVTKIAEVKLEGRTVGFYQYKTRTGKAYVHAAITMNNKRRSMYVGTQLPSREVMHGIARLMLVSQDEWNANHSRGSKNNRFVILEQHLMTLESTRHSCKIQALESEVKALKAKFHQSQIKVQNLV
ncbi:hypothetical protein [Microseira sp. BLCC-F43]|jgi:hypothetical protein|uniref:hypothetical protein n=1 Tax=Microseira sp. BLCC-F43 TaxID=3153602 RepID=UPI0035BB2E41